MCYVIERGIPLPANHKGTPRKFGPQCPLSEAMDALKVGESFLVETAEEFIRARGLVTGRKPKRFSHAQVSARGLADLEDRMNGIARLVKASGIWSWATTGEEYAIDMIEPEEITPAPPVPEIPAEVHNTRPIDPDTCMSAMRAMCGDSEPSRSK